MSIAIIVSEFNQEINDGLYSGALEVLQEYDVPKSSIHRFNAPGAFEIPLMAKTLAKSRKYQAILCLGCVIKGETAHFEYISESCAHGLQNAMLETGVPMGFGILTVYDREQAVARSAPGSENKGRECALACMKMIEFLR